MGKKKDKNKDKDKDQAKLKDNDRPGRKELAREVERLQTQNEALRARLDRIAEIAASDPEIEAQPAMAVLEVEEV